VKSREEVALVGHVYRSSGRSEWCGGDVAVGRRLVLVFAHRQAFLQISHICKYKYFYSYHTKNKIKKDFPR
jgi:hypothetical protein